MKARNQPKVWSKHEITTTKLWEKIGYIQLVSYLRADTTPHLEYSIDEGHRNQGIMSRELPKYLKKCKKYDNNQLIAVVKKDNLPSIKLLEKNGFFRVGEIDDKFSYVIDLRLTTEIIAAKLKTMKQAFPDRRIYD